MIERTADRQRTNFQGFRAPWDTDSTTGNILSGENHVGGRRMIKTRIGDVAEIC